MPGLDLATEREHLGRAERDIAEGETRVTRQADLVEQLRRDRHDTTRSEALLATLRETLEVWRAHREEIFRTIARLETAAREPTEDVSPAP